MPRQVKVNSLYKHFKGHIYKVIAIAKDTTDETLKVVYQNVATKDIWVRDYNEFISLVDKTKYPDVLQKYRFEEIDGQFLIIFFNSLTKTDLLVFNELKYNPHQTRDEIALKIGKTVRTVQRSIDKLKTNGKIIRIGNKNHGYWEVIDE